ncbi:MAG TPA: AraC family transcriptional regulator [Candidatus Eremiobacteraceae bacterium]|nr:AraC family transcriptional regulator [Candidatus Eremiobacteraceae bacterium]
MTDDEFSRFDTVLDYVEQGLDRDICLTDLACLVGLSVTHFSHIFKSEYGMAPYQYITMRRIERAKELLAATSQTIASVAAQLGFSSQSHFSEIFARLVGVTPSTYRRATRIAPAAPATLAILFPSAEKSVWAKPQEAELRKGGALRV